MLSGFPLVRADAILIEQVLTNVVANAVNHTPPVTRIVIDGEESPANVTVRVTDDGPGIPAEVLPRVFDRFVQSEQGLADSRAGTGLGLAIAKGIMEAHGARIGAVSPVANGRGTRIALTFPRNEPQS
jgi:two-component system sensor histidine kinase KdpD